MFFNVFYVDAATDRYFVFLSYSNSPRKGLRETSSNASRHRDTDSFDRDTTKPVERQVEARSSEDVAGSIVRSLYFADTFLINGDSYVLLVNFLKTRNHSKINSYIYTMKEIRGSDSYQSDIVIVLNISFSLHKHLNVYWILCSH